MPAMTARFLLITIALVSAVRTVHAGPYCGTGREFAPADGAILPVAPTIALVVEDSYYDGERRSERPVSRIRATIDGKRVSYTTKDVRGIDGMIRFVTITSRRTGKLELGVKNAYPGNEPLATYTISKDWKAPASISVEVSHGRDTRLSPYRRIGDHAVLRADGQVIAFSLRWRRDRDDRWRLLPLPSNTEDGHSVVRLGQTMCGMVENVPLAFLERGIEAELTGWLPNGRKVAITEGLPNPLVIPPLTDATKAADQD